MAIAIAFAAGSRDRVSPLRVRSVGTTSAVGGGDCGGGGGSGMTAAGEMHVRVC